MSRGFEANRNVISQLKCQYPKAFKLENEQELQ